MEGSNDFQARVDAAADFGFFLCIGRVVAVVGVAHESILQAEGVDGFGQAGRQGNYAANGLRDANGAAGLIYDFAERERLWRRSCSALRVRWRTHARKSGEDRPNCGMKSRQQQSLQESPTTLPRVSAKTKKPRETPGGFRLRPFSRRAWASA